MVIHHAPGHDEATKEITRRFAAWRYAAVCPNPNHRLTQRWRAAAEWARPILLAAAIGATVESVSYGLDHRWLMLAGAAASVPLFLLAWDMRAPELGRVSRWADLVTRGQTPGQHGEDPD